MLGLDGCKVQIEEVVNAALKQRAALYDDTAHHSFSRAQMLSRASLYNRQLLASGLIGVTVDKGDEAEVLKIAGMEWRERKLASYKAAVMELELLMHSGFLKPDYSNSPLMINFASPIDDEHFDILLKRLRLSP